MRMDIDAFELERKEVRALYSWQRVAQRTVKVYDHVTQRQRLLLSERFRNLSERQDLLSAILSIILISVQFLCIIILKYLRPENRIDICPDFQFEVWASRKTKIEPLPIEANYLSSLYTRRRFVMNGKSL